MSQHVQSQSEFVRKDAVVFTDGFQQYTLIAARKLQSEIFKFTPESHSFRSLAVAVVDALSQGQVTKAYNLLNNNKIKVLGVFESQVNRFRDKDPERMNQFLTAGNLYSQIITDIDYARSLHGRVSDTDAISASTAETSQTGTLTPAPKMNQEKLSVNIEIKEKLDSLDALEAGCLIEFPIKVESGSKEVNKRFLLSSIDKRNGIYIMSQNDDGLVVKKSFMYLELQALIDSGKLFKFLSDNT